MQTYPNFVRINDESHFDNLSSSDGNALLEKPTTMELRTIMITTSRERRNVALFHAIEKCHFMRFVFTYIHHLCD